LGLQQLAYSSTEWGVWVAGPVDYSLLPLFLLGPLFAVGALGGDAVESFIKRSRGVKSGASWFPFDQLDYVIGAIIVTLPFVVLTPAVYVAMLLIWFIVHIVASYVGYLVGLKKAPI
jgi:CDP-2,3-bis-(O-geranylgeranyl)-sn-glycerol synthase